MHLTLHLTARCNLRCRYCYAAPHGDTDMTLDTAKAAIALALQADQAKAKDGSLGVIFFGGEPLLKRDLIKQTVRHCKEIEARTGQFFHFKVTSNGILLDQEFLTDPETSQIFVALSHDGVEAAQDQGRVDALGAGTFRKLEPVIDRLLRHNPYSPVMKVVTPENVGNYAESVEYLFSRGFRYLICSLNYGATWEQRHLKELGRQYKTLADWYYRRMVAEEKFYFSPFEVKIASHVFPGSCTAERCELGKTQISVAPDGTLYPCVQFVGSGQGGANAAYAIGRVDTGIDETARERLYAASAAEKETCQACAIRERCNHYCGCLNRQATGRLDQVSPVLCAHERTILPIADKLAARLFKRKNPLFIQKHYNEMYPVISMVEDRSSKSGRQLS